jgi:hypothetical protein
MKTILIALFVFLTSYCSSFSQLDSNNTSPIIYGTLIEVNTGNLTIKEVLQDGTSIDRVIAYNSDTEIAGCTLDSVQRGVITLAMLTNQDAFPPIAQLIKFDGCIAHVDVMSIILAKTNSTIETKSTTESLFGPAGTAITFTYDAQSQVYSCDGQPLNISDFALGDTVYIRSAGNIQTPYASMIQATNDCIQTSQMEATLIALEDSAIIVQPDNSTDSVRISISTDFLWNWVPGDSSLPFPFYGCDGQLIPPSNVKPRMKVSVSYIISPRRGLFLQYAYLKENCPTHVSGIINAIDGDTISLGIYGQTTRVILTDETELVNCKGEIITKDKIKEGYLVDGLAWEQNGTNFALRLKIIDDCPFSYSADGKIDFINDSTLKLVTRDSIFVGNYAEMELAIDSNTVASDCMNLPINLKAIIAGSYVNVLYRMNGSRRIADMIIVFDPCNSTYISGVIEAVTGNTIVVKTDRGDLRSTEFNQASTIVNCRGEIFTPTSSVIGARFDGMTTDIGNGGFILNATIYTNCVEYDYVSGTISSTSDSLIIVITSNGIRDIYRYSNGIIMNESGQLVDMSELTFGRKVCLVVDKSTSVLLQGIVDITCENGVRDNEDGLMVRGRIEEVSNNVLTVSTNSGIMQFAITKATQMMDELRNTLQPISMSPGSEVRIMTKGHNTELKPIASTVVLMNALSINEPEIPQSQLIVYPNPASSVVSFGSMDYDTITISNMLGQTVSELNDVNTFDASSLNPGSYIIRATQSGKFFYTILHIAR